MPKIIRYDPVAIREALERLDQIAAEHPELITQEPETVSAWVQTLKESDDMTARPKEAQEDTVAVNIRLPIAMMERIDAVAQEMQTDGLYLSKSQVIRFLLDKGIKAQEAER